MQKDEYDHISIISTKRCVSFGSIGSGSRGGKVSSVSSRYQVQNHNGLCCFQAYIKVERAFGQNSKMGFNVGRIQIRSGSSIRDSNETCRCLKQGIGYDSDMRQNDGST